MAEETHHPRNALHRQLPAAEVSHLQRPLLIWDGQCGFCKYWVIRWEKMTGEKVQYAPYQEAADQFPTIPRVAFRRAAFLIEPGGAVYRGMGAAYRTFTYGGTWAFLFRWYDSISLFRSTSDRLYRWIAGHRPFMMQVTRFLFGKDPRHPRPYWLFWLALVVAVVVFFVFLLKLD